MLTQYYANLMDLTSLPKSTEVYFTAETIILEGRGRKLGYPTALADKQKDAIS